MAKISYLELSNRDYEYASQMYNLDYYNPCGRFCQQSVEKRLKHFINIKGNSSDLRKFSTHNLRVLYQRVCSLLSQATDRQTELELANLSDYYFDTNYPNDNFLELSKENAQKSLEITKEINNWIDASLIET